MSAAGSVSEAGPQGLVATLLTPTALLTGFRISPVACCSRLPLIASVVLSKHGYA
jgi:hypothetical protein